MLTSRPFDEVIERSQTRSFDSSTTSSSDQTGGDKAVIRGYAQRYLKEIISMLDIVPRQMLLIFKMNDCLRHVDYALGSPTNTLVCYCECVHYLNFNFELTKFLVELNVLLKGRGGEVCL